MSESEIQTVSVKRKPALRRRFLVVLFILFVVLCGMTMWNQGPHYGYVTGTITIDGCPAPADVEVSFQPQSVDGSPSVGVTNAEGQYEMYFAQSQKGVQLGLCYVRFEPPTSDDGKATVKIPKSYSEGDDHVVEVKPGHQTFDFDIKTKTDVEIEQEQDSEPAQ